MVRSRSVSFILPVFNGRKFISKAIDSLLSQQYENFRIIIINDGSTDESASVLSGFKDSRIVVVNCCDNKGLAHRLNQGIKLADSDYIARMDQDDIAYPDRLKWQVSYMEKNSNLIGSGADVSFLGIGGYSQFPHSPNALRSELLFRCSINHPTVILRRKMFIDAGFQYEARDDALEDYRLWQKITRTHDFGNLNKRVLQYRINADGMTRSSEKDAEGRDRSIANAYRENLLYYGIDFPVEKYLLIRSLFKGGMSLNEDHMLQIRDMFLFIRDELGGMRFCIKAMNLLFVQLLFYRLKCVGTCDRALYRTIQDLSASVWKFPIYSRQGIRQRMPFEVFMKFRGGKSSLLKY